MMTVTSFTELPDNLPVPEDDGVCDHLVGMMIPDISLASTAGEKVMISGLSGVTVLYCYPMTGRPGEELPAGWDDIPGARGCTPQSCAFRDASDQITALNARIFGLSTQDTAYQSEMATRLHLPFAVLSDAEYALSTALRLPLFEAGGIRLIKRVTLIISDGQIAAVHYPIFPSHSDPEWVISTLSSLKEEGR